MILVILLALLGGLLGACVRAAVAMWQIVHSSAGARLHEIGLADLAVQVMQLHLYAVLGAAVGGAIGVLLLWRRRRLRDEQRLTESALAADASTPPAPSDRLRTIQRENAERYLRQRRQKGR
jgi:hypothetical protein